MAIKQQLNEIANAKIDIKKKLSKIKIRYISIIYEGLSKGKTVKQIHKELYDATINKKSPLLKKAMVQTNKIAKKVNKNIKDQAKSIIGLDYSNVLDLTTITSIVVFDLLKKTETDKELSHEIYKEADKRENESKLEALENAMASSNVFYLASKHGDSAKDHEPWQGKLYYNKNWMSIITSEVARHEIAAFIDDHNLKTVQWVTDKPVYFITRPNCRHYFREIPVKEALQTNVKTLLNRYDMDTPIGNRAYLQTQKSNGRSRKVMGEIRNAQLIIQKYRERLVLLENLYKKVKNPIVLNAIGKTKHLIQKWSEYYEKLSNKK